MVIITEQDLNVIEKRLSDIFATKQDLVDHKSEIMNGIDKVISELVKIRENQEILTPKTYDLQERVESLEKLASQN